VIFALTQNAQSWPVRSISFSFDGEYLASGSEELNIDIVKELFGIFSLIANGLLKMMVSLGFKTASPCAQSNARVQLIL
jgi:hypothetical protein